ncbi:MAG: tripeptide aminopeptidase, partial [Myxococcota bacterium]
MPVQLPSVSDADLAKLAFSNLASIVAIDSQSDESSPSIPSTDGQRILADFVGDYFATLGATVERDAFANVIATFEGRGDGIGAPPLALMVHLDTARGTEAVDDLKVVPAWSGDALSYAENPALTVSTKTYPAVAPFVGQDVVHGGGRAPFGLDDKLG